MSGFQDADCIVEGKKIRDWAKSDEGLVAYGESEFGKNVSTSQDYVIYDLGAYEYDDKVNMTVCYNGLDMSRVAGCVKYHEPYDGMSLVTAINGDDYVRIFFGGFHGATIEDFVLYFFRLLDGDIYISENNYRVYVRGRIPTGQEEWEDAVDALYRKRQ